jgi:hypothetical protein
MAKLLSVMAALKEAEVSLSAQTVLQLMERAALVENVEYVSSSGSGEIKKFSRLTEAGLGYGANKATFSPTKTDIKIDPTKVKDILVVCHEAFGRYVSSL